MGKMKAITTNKTGKRTTANYEALLDQVNEVSTCKKSDNDTTLNTVREALATAYQRFANEKVDGSAAAGLGTIDITQEQLVEACHFSRSDQAHTLWHTHTLDCGKLQHPRRQPVRAPPSDQQNDTH